MCIRQKTDKHWLQSTCSLVLCEQFWFTMWVREVVSTRLACILSVMWKCCSKISDWSHFGYLTVRTSGTSTLVECRRSGTFLKTSVGLRTAQMSRVTYIEHWTALTLAGIWQVMFLERAVANGPCTQLLYVVTTVPHQRVLSRHINAHHVFK